MDWLQHFDPDPQWYIWSLHIITFISFPIYIISMVCILRVDIASNSTYKYLLASNVTMFVSTLEIDSLLFRSYLTQLSLSAGTIPILTLPACGGYPVGFLTLLGFSTCFQCALVLSLGIGRNQCQPKSIQIVNGLTTTMLFFYRSHMAVTFSRTFFNGTMALFVIFGVVVPLIMNTLLCETMDTTKTKEAFQKKYPHIFALLPDHVKSDTLMIVDIFLPVQIVFYYFGLLLLAATFLIIFFNYRATVILRRHIYSSATLSLHQALVRCLVIQSAAYYILFSVPASFILLIAGFHQNLPAGANVAFIILSLSDPAGVMALILGHKRFRRAVLRPFKRERVGPETRGGEG